MSPTGVLAEVLTGIGALAPVVAFLVAILVVTEMCAAAGLFRATGTLIARVSRGGALATFRLGFLAAVVTTAVLGLDATAVLLAPVLAAAAGVEGSPRPLTHASIRLANSGSVLLPGANLTNLLALPFLHLGYLAFAVAMAPVGLAVLAVEYAGQRRFFAGELTGTAPPRRPERVPLPRFPVTVLALMLGGFVACDLLGLPLWLAAGAAAIALAARALREGQTTGRRVVSAMALPFAVVVLVGGALVHALATELVDQALGTSLRVEGSLAGLLLVALVATVAANLVNNLPAALVLLPVLAPSGTTVLLAALVGLNVGSNLTYPGSLANLLWRRGEIRRGGPPPGRTFHRLSATLTPPAVVLGTVALWLTSGTTLA